MVHHNRELYENRTYWSALHSDRSGQLTAVGYHALGEGFNRATYRLRLAALARLLDRVWVRRTPCELLDNAVGVGAYSTLWASFGITRWVGTDISQEAVDLMRSRWPDSSFIQADLASPLYPLKVEGSFDIVTAIDVLYHLVDDADFERALRNVSTKVRRSGCLIVSDIFAPTRLQTADHVVRRPLAQYQALLSKNGFTLVGREPIFGILGDPLRNSDAVSRVLFLAWRVLQKTIRLTPSPLRDAFGFGLASMLTPVDAIVRSSGLAASRNLEFIAFRRST